MEVHTELKECLKGGMPEHSRDTVVLSMRVRLARNLQKFPFPNWANDRQRTSIFEICREVVKGLPCLKSPVVLPMSELNEFERRLLLERHCVSPELVQGKPGAGMVVDPDQSFVCMINEEDHLRLQILSLPGLSRQAHRMLNTVDEELESSLSYAFSPEWGYLTACPTNLGLGMRVSAMLHLPGLVLSESMKSVVRALSEMDTTVRGLFGEQSKAAGNVFQVSNSYALGSDEKGLLDRFEKIVKSLVEKEQKMRARLLEKDQNALFDRIVRSYGTLSNSYTVSCEEALTLLSLVRLGIDLGFFPKTCRRRVEALWVQVRPAHLQWVSNTLTTENTENVLRAEFLRKKMSGIPAPIFK
ncbi:MAG: ATP--guanido phosphotransferase [Puniceicoccales bacterium]|jgi:protein arginine kinase|nr:ATP--guanido phosphotransferase [Puniceicoccales bacterium]